MPTVNKMAAAQKPAFMRVCARFVYIFHREMGALISMKRVFSVLYNHAFYKYRVGIFLFYVAHHNKLRCPSCIIAVGGGGTGQA